MSRFILTLPPDSAMQLQGNGTSFVMAVVSDTRRFPMVVFKAGIQGEQGLQGDSWTASHGIATLNFGTGNGSNEASVHITGQAGIVATSIVNVFVLGDAATASHTANDHRYFSMLAALSVGDIEAGVGFHIYATSAHKLTGEFSIKWSWG